MNMFCTACARLYHTGADVPIGSATDRGADRDFRCCRCQEAELQYAMLPPVLVTKDLRSISRMEANPPDRLGKRVSLLAQLRRLIVPFVVLGLAAASMTAVGARTRVVAMLPATAPVFAAIGLSVDLSGLAVENVRARLGEIGDKKVLVVEGSIVNMRAGDNVSPDLRIRLRDSGGNELYIWTTRAPKSRLLRGEHVLFAARLETPPEGVKDAVVEFVTVGS